jgi:hypothetical protein
MRSSLVTFATMLLLLAPSAGFGGETPAPSTAAPQTIFVPAGTAVPVHIVGTISSGSAQPGDTFQIQVASDVVSHNMIVFYKDARGQGHIVAADSAGGNGHSGSIGLAFDYVYAADGGRVALSQAAQQQTEEDRKGASSTATIIGYAAFGLGGLFGHNLAHGRQKTIDQTTIMSAFVSDNVHVAATDAAQPVRYDK